MTTLNEQIIDAAAWGQLQHLFADAEPGALEEILGAYLEESRGRLKDLRCSLEVRDTEKVRKTAHSLRGACNSIGACMLGRLSERIELEARAGRMDGLAPLVRLAENEFGRVHAQLQPLAQAVA